VICSYKRGHWYCLASLYWLALSVTLTESTGRRRIKHIKINKTLNAVIPTVQLRSSPTSEPILPETAGYETGGKVEYRTRVKLRAQNLRLESD
jgi:hypothetical protein